MRENEYYILPSYRTNKKELVSEFNGMIEGSYGATPYHFGGYEGCVRLYRTPIVSRNANYRYEIEATLYPLANDYMVCARPEYKIWGQHPYLKDNDRIVFKQDDRGMNAEEWFKAFRHNEFEKVPILDLLHMFWILYDDHRVKDNWFIYERIAYILQGDMTLLEKAFSVHSANPYFDSPYFDSFEYKNNKRAIVTKKTWEDREVCVYFGGNKGYIYMDITITAPNNLLLETILPRLALEYISHYKNPEIPYPHL